MKTHHDTQPTWRTAYQRTSRNTIASRFTALTAILLSLTAFASADTIHVPDDFPEIQFAIIVAEDGDEILVAPGTYNEQIDFLGKAITVKSTEGPEKTIIDAEGAGVVVTCDDGESADTVLNGFTITGGNNGGMTNIASSPTVAACIFQNNSAETGAGMYNDDSSPTLTSCVFENNAANSSGGGMFNSGTSEPSIEESVFCENEPNNISGDWIDNGGNCLADLCIDDDANGVPDPCETEIVQVPGDVKTIQDAIDFALAGTQIIVAPGTYNETINFNGKAVTLVSSEGPEVTVIDGQGNGTVVTCNSGEGPDTVLEGFTITGGNSPNGGGGMRNASASPTVTNCVFKDNLANSGGVPNSGGGMYNGDSSPILTDCVFENNSAVENGGGVYNDGSSPTVQNCTFLNNSADGNGGGMSSQDWSSPTVTNCSFEGNSAGFVGGGMYNLDHSHPTVTNCTFANNSGYPGNAIYTGGDTSAPAIGDSVFCENGNKHIYGFWNDKGGNCFADICVECIPCPANFNEDGEVSVGDLLVLLEFWGTDGPGADIAEPNDVVTVADLLGLLAAWGTCPYQ